MSFQLNKKELISILFLAIIFFASTFFMCKSLYFKYQLHQAYHQTKKDTSLPLTITYINQLKNGNFLVKLSIKDKLTLTTTTYDRKCIYSKLKEGETYEIPIIEWKYKDEYRFEVVPDFCNLATLIEKS